MNLPPVIGRRTFVLNAGLSLGAMALASCEQTRVISRPAVAAKAKRIIWLYMAGGISQFETFDYKPLLAKLDGQPMPESITKGQQLGQLQGQKLVVMGPQHEFRKWGDSGQSIGVILPEVASKCADEICIVRSIYTDAISHDRAHTFMNTGSTIAGRPAVGSWIWYGLGNEAEALPGFVVMVSTGRFGIKQPIAARQWHSGFLPGRFQGVEFRSGIDPVLYLKNPDGVSRKAQRDLVEAVQSLDRLESEQSTDPEIATRISQYEMAFRMQTSVPDLLDFTNEPQHILDLYGTWGSDGSFASNCLLARRLAERGVRFIQIYHRDWDHHAGVKEHIQGAASEVDRATAALMTDLKQRGMLDDSIVVFGSEFGRSPMAQGDGRDHHRTAFTMWFAGGGIKPGLSLGATDEFGYHAVENRVSVHDVHATLLHLMGLNHAQLSFTYQGAETRLTGVGPCRVINEMLV
ncbi:MAG TPA: DUF1501 domain-containing protein [Planctomycetaceae bacterium]|jgi:hypothetical protein|nr:DUF1501 domain-containing protein [Planctomycetaceae bacterium]